MLKQGSKVDAEVLEACPCRALAFLGFPWRRGGRNARNKELLPANQHDPSFEGQGGHEIKAGADYEVNNVQVSGAKQGAIDNTDAGGRVNAPPWLLQYFLSSVYWIQSRDYISYPERS